VTGPRSAGSGVSSLLCSPIFGVVRDRRRQQPCSKAPQEPSSRPPLIQHDKKNSHVPDTPHAAPPPPPPLGEDDSDDDSETGHSTGAANNRLVATNHRISHYSGASTRRSARRPTHPAGPPEGPGGRSAGCSRGTATRGRRRGCPAAGRRGAGIGGRTAAGAGVGAAAGCAPAGAAGGSGGPAATGCRRPRPESRNRENRRHLRTKSIALTTRTVHDFVLFSQGRCIL